MLTTNHATMRSTVRKFWKPILFASTIFSLFSVIKYMHTSGQLLKFTTFDSLNNSHKDQILLYNFHKGNKNLINNTNANPNANANPVNNVTIPDRGVEAYLKLHKTIINSDWWKGRPLLIRTGILTNPTAGKNLDAEHIGKLVTGRGINISALASYPITESMAEWEWTVLKGQPLVNASLVGDIKKSRFFLQSSKTTFRVGDTAQVRIDILDAKGRQLLRGGDDVRVLLEEPTKAASLSPEVKDLGNGSYITMVPLLWPGEPVIRVQLKYNAEFIRTYHRLLNAVKSVKLYMAEFSNSVASEATICLHFPINWYYQKFCDLSPYNGGVKWYCGHPRSGNLSCDDYKTNRDLDFTRPLPVSKVEKMFNVVDHGFIPNQINLKVNARENTLPLKQTNISELNRSSWKLQAPRGYFMNNTWNPVNYAMKQLTKEQLRHCLKNTTLYLNGDSNLRLAFIILEKRLGCEVTTKYSGAWHRPLHCIDKNNSIAIHWQVHGIVFHGGANKWCDKSHYQHVVDTLDQIPDQGRYVVMVHLFLHYTYHHYSMFAQHMTAIRKAMERVLSRNPNIKLVVRGPHQAFTKWKPLQGGDLIAPVFTRIIREEFSNIYDKVFFILPWEMTIATMSGDFHPFNYINEALADMFVDYICNQT